MTFSQIRQKCKRESDYIITLFLTNEISLGLTYLLVKTNITPNQVTLMSIFCGLICAVCFAFGSLTVGSICLFLSHIFDCTDGNLARATQNFHPKGKWYDMVGDRITEAAIFIGVAIYFHQHGAPSQWYVLSLLDGLIISLYFYLVDTKLIMGLSESRQKLTRWRFKNVNVKWGLLEPIYYGFIVLSPLGWMKVQIILVLMITIAGTIYQLIKTISPTEHSS